MSDIRVCQSTEYQLKLSVSYLSTGYQTGLPCLVFLKPYTANAFLGQFTSCWPCWTHVETLHPDDGPRQVIKRCSVALGVHIPSLSFTGLLIWWAPPHSLSIPLPLIWLKYQALYKFMYLIKFNGGGYSPKCYIICLISSKNFFAQKREFIVQKKHFSQLVTF